MMRRFRSYPTIGGRRGGIPADCVEVEYLQTDGASYITTGLSSTFFTELTSVGDTASFELDALIASATSPILGVYGCTPFNVVSSNWCFFNLSTYGYYAWTNMTINERHNLTWTVTLNLASGYNTQSLTVDGVQDATRGNTRATYPVRADEGKMYLGHFFGSDGGHSIAPSGSRFYSLKHYIKGELVADYVPVRRVESGVSVGYMCDRLTGELYGNQGTGAFVVGPDAGR